jgi:hypothetical protein
MSSPKQAPDGAQGVTGAPNSTRFKPGNTAAVKAGLRSPMVRARNRKVLRAKIRAEVVAMAPKLSRVEIDLETDTLSDLEQARDYIEKHGGLFSPRGQTLKVAKARDDLVARHENWCRRNGVGYQSSTSASRAAEEATDAEAAHKRLLARYAQESE